MTWKQLLADGSVAKHRTSRAEVDSLRSVVVRDLKDAALAGLSADSSFATSYRAVLALCKIVIACAGYRVKGEGAHRALFDALELAMGPSVGVLASYFDACRRKRNILSYDVAGSVSQTEAAELLRRATDFQIAVAKWVATNHPELA